MAGSMSAGEQAAMFDWLDRQTPPCVKTMGGRLEAIDIAAGTATMSFEMIPAFCHSGTIVQGGFITGMIDAAMSHALLARCGMGHAVPTLEIKVSFFEPGNPGRYRAVGRVARQGRSTAFLEGELYNETGALVARASSTAKIVSPKR